MHMAEHFLTEKGSYIVYVSMYITFCTCIKEKFVDVCPTPIGKKQIQL